ncbi:BLUF domain-containing protein [Acinetobacter sp. B5B]|uniref:BLUF domain-containing protein n=1 Tax=Acinetobacter baretiae TaxID=2605383 RepID=UPI0018C29082|nr:BLUF domain-containing protein [Acinetobacter baretiae]MBF7684194.1 BLUF domain-containing protein [Acinetobacter baretiae]MBF7686547.1 BLUF domain-containing protein [Acinetobacter baretiae]
MRLHFLCYSSIRTSNHENLLDEIEDILKVARDFNKRHQITGVLYYSHGQFFQYIEGYEPVIESLFDRIAVDPRHHFIHYYGTLPTEYRRFKDWSMKYVQGNSKVRELLERREKEYPISYELIQDHLVAFIDELIRSGENKIR